MRIERGVPIPAPVRGRGRRSRYPFDDMQPGDSFEAAGAKAGSLQQAARRVAMRTGWRFTTRQTETGARCWRVE